MPASDFERLKILGHPQRLAILRRLMAAPATLSQLGEHFEQTPAHIRHHLKALEGAGLVEADAGHPQQNHLEKYYRAAEGALLVNLAVLPEPPAGRAPIVLASKDLAMRSLAQHLNRQGLGFALQVVPMNSLEGLIGVRQGLWEMTTCHLLDAETGRYNRPFVQRLFPGQPVAVVQMFRREEGLMVAPGNPLGLRGLEDLTRPGVTFVNRERGSGIRIWLDLHLERQGVPAGEIRGYEREVRTHIDVAETVAQGRADAGLGIAASARQYGLEFIPLFEEPYELAVPAASLGEPAFAPFFERLNAGEFRTAIRKLDGYQVPQVSGQVDIVD